MTLKYLLDTNVVSEPLRPKPNIIILKKLRSFQNEIGIAAIVWHELLFGCYRLPESERRKAIETYLFDVVGASFPILPYGERAARWHAVERARLTSIGNTPPFADGQITAIAAVSNLVLITRNTSDYEFFQNIEVEDWSD